jgi:hypothetical protein
MVLPEERESGIERNFSSMHVELKKTNGNNFSTKNNELTR